MTEGRGKNDEFVETFRTSALTKEQAIREQIAAACNGSLPKLPSIDRIQRHWNNSARLFLTQVHRMLREGANAQTDRWDLQRCGNFVASFDLMMEALDVGWDLGFRDATGVVYQRKGKGSDPFGCGAGPTYPEGASCSLRCSMERDWCLCRAGCGQIVDCSSWPCTECVNCNIDHAICALDCIFSAPPPPPDKLNPVVAPVLARSVSL